MGLHNRITEDKYNKIKKYINSKKAVKEPKVLDNAVVEAFGIGLSSARNIRLTDNYQAYCERVFRFHGHPGKKAKPAAKESVETRTERRINSNLKDVDHLIERYADDMWTSSILLGGIEKLCMGMDKDIELAREDIELLFENQIELNKKLRTYVILDGILIGVMLALLIMTIIGRVYGN